MRTPNADVDFLKQALGTEEPTDKLKEIERLFRLRLLIECQLRGVIEPPEDSPTGVHFAWPRKSDWLFFPQERLRENPAVIEGLEQLEDSGHLALIEEDEGLLVYVLKEEWIVGPEASEIHNEGDEQYSDSQVVITIMME